MIDEFAQQFPWSSKIDKLHGRYTGYRTLVPRQIPNDPGNFTSDTRRYFISRAQQVVPSSLFDMAIKRDSTNSDMARWAAYRYVVSLNGRAVSNSIQQLLTLGSLVFVESNGYETWFSGALRPYEHYVPIWEEGGKPEDVAAALSWAQENQSRAHQIAKSGTQFARVHLGPQGRRCYWQALWRQLGTRQPYFENAVTSGRRMLVPVREFLEDLLASEVGRSHLQLELKHQSGKTKSTVSGLVGRCPFVCCGSIKGWDYCNDTLVSLCSAKPCYPTFGPPSF